VRAREGLRRRVAPGGRRRALDLVALAGGALTPRRRAAPVATDGTAASADLPAVLSSASAARQVVRLAGARWMGTEALDTLELLTSEIVTNALLHGRAEPHLVVTVRGQTVRVAVDDQPSGWPRPKAVPVLSQSGRGLALVDALASSWGVEQLPEDRKRVWFEVRA